MLTCGDGVVKSVNDKVMLDVSGETADAEHQLFKTRLDKDGNTIETEKVKELNLAKNRDSREAEEIEKCGSCYGAESETHKCCQTCEDVLSAYREKGWGVEDPRKFEQCEKGKEIMDFLGW